MPRGHTNSNVEKIFANLDLQDRAQILDKLHMIRMKAADKWGGTEPSKPHLAAMPNNDKDKIIG